MGFSRQEYWSGLPCSLPGNLPSPGIEPAPLMSPVLAGRFFTTGATQVKMDIILTWAPLSPIFPFAEWGDWTGWSQRSIQRPSSSQVGAEDGGAGGGDRVEVDRPGFLQATECVLRQASRLAAGSRASTSPHPQDFKTQPARSRLPFSSLFLAQDLTPGFSLFPHRMTAVLWARERSPWVSLSAHPHTPLNNWIWVTPGFSASESETLRPARASLNGRVAEGQAWEGPGDNSRKSTCGLGTCSLATLLLPLCRLRSPPWKVHRPLQTSSGTFMLTHPAPGGNRGSGRIGGLGDTPWTLWGEAGEQGREWGWDTEAAKLGLKFSPWLWYHLMLKWGSFHDTTRPCLTDFLSLCLSHPYAHPTLYLRSEALRNTIQL